MEKAVGFNHDYTGRAVIRMVVGQPEERHPLSLALPTVRASQILTFGWPIAVLFENRAEYKPLSYRHASDLLAEVGNDDGGHVTNRLTFAHHVTAVKAYLGEGTIRQFTRGLTAQ
jgi:hypothetical protein